MLLYFPRNLAGLVALASNHDGRFATCALHVLDPGDGTYRIEVTDGKRLAVVRGPNASACYPALAATHDGEGGSVLVQAVDWKSAFRTGERGRPVGLAACGHDLTLAVGDQAVVTRPFDGRFPKVADVLPKKPALVSVRLSPELLRGLLTLAAALEPVSGVALLYYGPGLPLGLTAHNETGQFLDALLMPLS